MNNNNNLRPHRGKRVWIISGFNQSNARKLCRFLFRDFLISCDLNERERQFEIRLHKQLVSKTGEIFKIEDHVDIQDFREFWGSNFKLIYIVGQEVQK